MSVDEVYGKIEVGLNTSSGDEGRAMTISAFVMRSRLENKNKGIVCGCNGDFIFLHGIV